MIGKTFERLKVIQLDRIVKYTTQTKVYYLCKCTCGKSKVVRGDHLRSGRIKSCGCLAKAIHANRMKNLGRTHGLSNTLSYNSYTAMLKRTLKPDELHKKYYRNITVCERWLGIDGLHNFISDMGLRPSKEYSLDRINNYGNYEPTNCRWATRSEQMLNTRRQY